MPAEYVTTAAAFRELSNGGLHRLNLRRWWDFNRRPAVFIGLNPSTAGADEDDPTIRRCVRFARDWGFGGLIMVNLFSRVATDPDELRAAKRRTHPENEYCIRAAVSIAGVVVGGWGAHPLAADRARELRDAGALGDYAVLGLTKSGAPRHPLYMRATCVPLDRRTLAPVALLPAALDQAGEGTVS